MSNESLDVSPEAFRVWLDKSADLVQEQFTQLEEQKGYHAYSQKTVVRWFEELLPEEGMDVLELLEETRDKVLNTATGNLGPHMYAYVMASGTQMSIIADQLASTINQNQAKWHLAPAINEIEKRVIQWGAEMIGFGRDVGGLLVSGGSAANLDGLTVARNICFAKHDVRKKGLYGFPPLVVYASEEVHGCIDKSVEMLGIGSDQLRKVNTNDDFTVDVSALEEQIKQDLANGLKPFCLVGTAGTVNTGAIDDLDALADLADKYDLWFHIDGAYGGLAAMLPHLKPRYKGIERADSIAVDFHKWLYQPFEAGCVMVRNWETLRKAYYKNAAYLDNRFEQDKGRIDLNEHSFPLSRGAKSLKIWMSIKAYGMARIRAMVQKDIDLTHYLADEVLQSNDFELKSRSHLAVVCFRYIGDLQEEADIVRMNELLIPALEKDGRVFITGTRLNGEFVIRACVINHRKQRHTIDFLLNVIREVAAAIDLEKEKAVQ